MRCTWRALEDLGLDPALGRNPAGDLTDAHEVINAFVAQRSQSPVGPEATYLPVTRVPVYNLHRGRWRGLTWHEFEDDLDVVWLLGVGWHETGSRNDAYAVLKRRDNDETLFPDEIDYGNLEPDPQTTQDFLDALTAVPAKLIAQARQEPGQSAHGTLADVLDVSVVVERMADGDDVLEDLYIAFYLPPKEPGVLPDQWQPVAFAAFFPDTALQTLTYGPPYPAALRAREGWIEVIRGSTDSR
jgi:hypothetical protein